MSTELVFVILFVSLLAFLLIGVPIAWVLGGISVLLAVGIIGPQFLGSMPPKVFSYMNSFVVIALPLFIFMAVILERSGIAEDLYTMMDHFIGFMPGGLAIGTVVVCTIFAAMSGVSAAATVTMGIIALPIMLRHGYDKKIAVGCIMTGGALGVLIPPSILMIVLAMVTGESVGRLFMGGVFPGLLLSALFIVYIAVRTLLKPSLAPPVPPEERLPWRQRLIFLRGVILPIILVVLVLGSIFAGIASPTEASALGCLGSIIMGVARRRLSWKDLKEASYRTLRITGMVMWIIFGGTLFTSFALAVRIPGMVYGVLMAVPGGPTAIMVVIQVLLFILGMILDPTAIVMLVMPLFTPVVRDLGFDVLWFQILFVVNMQMAFITPPVGYNLFYMKGIVTKEQGISMGDIYRSIIPFVILQGIGLVICIIFPQIALWLPNLLIRRTTG